MARVHFLEACKLTGKKPYFLKRVQSYHDHQKCAQEKERSENESPEEISDIETTYHLTNDRLSRELSQNSVINHLPTSKSVVAIQRLCK